MKLLQSLLEGLNGQQKAAEKMGKNQGDSGKPMMSKVQVEKSFGPGMWQIYSNAYEEAKNRYKSKDDHDAWKEKTAAKRQGRMFHESKEETYEVGEKVMTMAGGKWHEAVITKPPHKETGNYGVRFKVGKTTVNTVSSLDQLKKRS